MCKLLCTICNKEYKNLNQHYETKLHKNKVEEKNKKIRDIEEYRQNLLKRLNPTKYNKLNRIKKINELLNK